MKKNLTKNILFSLLFLVAFFFVYVVFIKKDDASPLLGREESQSEEAKLDQELVALLESLEVITLDTKIFETRTFDTLQENSVQVFPQLKGRLNPFAPF